MAQSLSRHDTMMTTARFRTPLLASAAISLALALSACGEQREDPPADPEPTTSPAPEPSQSIIREGFEEPEAGLPLEPLQLTIGFGEGGSELSEEAKAQIGTILESDQAGEGWPITIRGHSDAGGNDATNLRVSRERAQAVADALIEGGIAEDRVSVIAFGEQNPLQPNALPDGSPNEPGRAANRRVDVTIAPAGGAASSADQSDNAEAAEGG